ncbi:hypothetical protein KKH23_04735 [Patescibacteria group bacterium]|nr:hypothetical protein [Patescibacteria group bacterium]
MQVKIIRSKEHVSLVEYWEGESPRRVWIPTSEVQEDDVGKETIRQGVEYGLPWAQIINKAIDAQAFELLLKNRGIWTYQDLSRNRNVLAGVIKRTLSIEESKFLENVKNYLV